MSHSLFWEFLHPRTSYVNTCLLCPFHHHVMINYLLIFLSFSQFFSQYSSRDIDDPWHYPAHAILKQRQQDYRRLYRTNHSLPPSLVSDQLGYLSPRQYKNLNSQLSELRRLRGIDSRVIIVNVWILWRMFYSIIFLVYRSLLMVKLPNLSLHDYLNGGILPTNLVNVEW